MGLFQFGKKKGLINVKWVFDAKSEILSPPAIVETDKGQSAVVGTKEGEMFMVDASGNVLWKFDIKQDVGEVEGMFLDAEQINSIHAPPAAADLDGDKKTEIVFGSELGTLFCLREDGRALWKLKTGGAIRGTPLVEDVNNDGKLEIVFGSYDGNVYVLEGGSGKVLEMHEIGAPVSGEIAYLKSKDSLVFGDEAGVVHCVRVMGESLWKFPTEGKITARPVCKVLTEKEELIIVGSHDHNLYALTIDGELKWKFPTEGAILSSVAVADFNDDSNFEIVFGSCDNRVYALSCTGDKIWSYETNFWVASTPVVMDIDGDGQLEVVAGSYDHSVYVLDAGGRYMLDYVPGISGIVNQSGHYSDFLTREAGENIGKKLWQYKTEGVVVGCAGSGESVIVNTKIGKVDNLVHEKK